MPRKSNKKRVIAGKGTVASARLRVLSGQVTYRGNPKHKLHPNLKHPGIEPGGNRSRSVCDKVKSLDLSQKEASALLKEGVRKGLVSATSTKKFPNFIWAVSSRGQPYEAKQSKDKAGEYYGYPLLGDEDQRFLKALKARWSA